MELHKTKGNIKDQPDNDYESIEGVESILEVFADPMSHQLEQHFQAEERGKEQVAIFEDCCECWRLKTWRKIDPTRVNQSVSPSG